MTPLKKADVAKFIKALSPADVKTITELVSAFPLNIRFQEVSSPPVHTGDNLADINKKPIVSVAFPPCSEVMLALYNENAPDKDQEFIDTHFKEYFKFTSHSVVARPFAKADHIIDDALWDCLLDHRWPPASCLPSSCASLDGTRDPKYTGYNGKTFKRLFLGDLVWLFYFERLGIFKILGVILDDFARTGKIPISNGSLDPTLKDDIIALVLEAMVRQTKVGLSSTVRDRDSSYHRCLGWCSESGRKLRLPSVVNKDFSTLFHKLIYNALEFYKDKRLAVAIRGAAGTVAQVSTATLITISDTVDMLQKQFSPFDYSRNYFNTLNGIVWIIAGISLIRGLRETLGIPKEYKKPHEYIPAAYDLLVLKRQITPSEVNRYTVHRNCANYARTILLDLEPGTFDHKDTRENGMLRDWLNQIEDKIEGYRTNYRILTGIDLGASATPRVEQEA